MLLCNKYCACVLFETYADEQHPLYYEYNLFNIGEWINLFVFSFSLFLLSIDDLRPDILSINTVPPLLNTWKKMF